MLVLRWMLKVAAHLFSEVPPRSAAQEDPNPAPRVRLLFVHPDCDRQMHGIVQIWTAHHLVSGFFMPFASVGFAEVGNHMETCKPLDTKRT